MKKIVCCLPIAFLIAGALAGCGNKDLFDTTYRYDSAMIEIPGGDVITGPVTSWTDYADGDQIQVTINGKTYLVHSSNIVLINE